MEGIASQLEAFKRIFNTWRQVGVTLAVRSEAMRLAHQIANGLFEHNQNNLAHRWRDAALYCRDNNLFILATQCRLLLPETETLLTSQERSEEKEAQ